MATTRKLTRTEQLQESILYPIDWLEERSGLVGGLKYFLFRKVPAETNWFHTLGSATLTAFLVQALTGVILAMYYRADPNTAYSSIQHITNDVTLGWLVRGMHKWGAVHSWVFRWWVMAPTPASTGRLGRHSMWASRRCVCTRGRSRFAIPLANNA